MVPGFSLLGGGGGVSLVPGGCSPETPPVYRITDTCKNITLATTSLRPVKIVIILIDANKICHHCKVANQLQDFTS